MEFARRILLVTLALVSVFQTNKLSAQVTRVEAHMETYSRARSGVGFDFTFGNEEDYLFDGSVPWSNWYPRWVWNAEALAGVRAESDNELRVEQIQGGPADLTATRIMTYKLVNGEAPRIASSTMVSNVGISGKFKRSGAIQVEFQNSITGVNAASHTIFGASLEMGGDLFFFPEDSGPDGVKAYFVNEFVDYDIQFDREEFLLASFVGNVDGTVTDFLSFKEIEIDPTTVFTETSIQDEENSAGGQTMSAKFKPDFQNMKTVDGQSIEIISNDFAHPNGVSLRALARTFGYEHFNWRQTITFPSNINVNKFDRSLTTILRQVSNSNYIDPDYLFPEERTVLVENSQSSECLVDGVSEVDVNSGGSGYLEATTTVTFSPPTDPEGQTAQGTAVVINGVITEIQITNPGFGYSTPPTVTISDSFGGSGASASANVLFNCALVRINVLGSEFGQFRNDEGVFVDPNGLFAAPDSNLGYISDHNILEWVQIDPNDNKQFLLFEDTPGGPDGFFSRQDNRLLEFKTELVGVRDDFAIEPLGIGFTWDTDGTTVGNVVSLGGPSDIKFSGGSIGNVETFALDFVPASNFFLVDGYDLVGNAGDVSFNDEKKLLLSPDGFDPASVSLFSSLKEDAPDTLRFQIESRVVPIPNDLDLDKVGENLPKQLMDIYLYDFEAGSLELMLEDFEVDLTDRVALVELEGDTARFVENLSGRVCAEVVWNPILTMAEPIEYAIEIDAVKWWHDCKPSSNLLKNFSFENGFEEWTTTGDPGIRTEKPEAYAGANYVFGPGTPHFTLNQEVDLIEIGFSPVEIDKGNLQFQYGGWQAGYANQNDFGTISIRILDEDGALVGSGSLPPFTSFKNWELQEEIVTLPAGTRKIQIQFDGIRNTGNNNDSYLDSVFLRYITN